MDFVRLLRPQQWIKNAFVFAPLVFSGSFTKPSAIVAAVVATAVFCVASSAVYVLNDLADVESDRQHPVKRLTRPLAAGTVTVGQARALLLGLMLMLIVGFVWRPATAGVVIGYVALNVAYSLWLKRVPVVDLFSVAGGFVLRVFAGAVAIDVDLSSWMLITTLCLALYLAALKRRAELGERGAGARTVLGSYTVALLDRYAEISAVGAIVFYSLFVLQVRPGLALTIPLVLFGLFRYWYVVEDTGGESPTDALWHDWLLGLTVVVWGGVCAYGIWHK